MGMLFDIEEAFQLTLKNIEGSPYIAFQGLKPYTPTLGVRWWRTTNLGTSTSKISADGITETLGVYQVDIFCPLGKGMKQVLLDADTISETFNIVPPLDVNETLVYISGASPTRIYDEESGQRGIVKINYKVISNPN